MWFLILSEKQEKSASTANDAAFKNWKAAYEKWAAAIKERDELAPKLAEGSEADAEARSPPSDVARQTVSG